MAHTTTTAVAKATEFLSKELAAERLGLSIRRLMEISQSEDSPLKRHTQFDPITKRDAVFFKANEIVIFEAKMAEKSKMPPARALVRRATFEAAPAVEAKPRPQVFISHNWLTLDEAAGYTALPLTCLRCLIRDGKLRVLDVGPRKGGRYRVKPADLDAIAGELITGT